MSNRQANGNITTNRKRGSIAFVTCLALAGACIPAVALANNNEVLGDLASTNVTAVAQGDLTSNENIHWALGTSGSLAINGEGALAADDALYDIADQVETIYIGKDISCIGAETFSFFNSLKAVEFEEGSALESVEAYAFANCPCLESISLPASVRSIGTAAFQDCSALSLLSFGEGASQLEAISSSVFSNCTSLASMPLPSALKSIDSYAFDGCESLESITIPASVEKVGAGAFENCPNLKNITVEDPSKTSIDKSAFAGNTQTKPLTVSITKMKAGKRCATIKWSKVKGATSYKVCYKKRGTAKYKNKTVKTAKAKLKKLTRGKRYKVYVVAKAGKDVLCKSPTKTTARIK